MDKHLFANFLSDNIVYQTCKEYWQVKIRHILHQNNITGAKPYLNTTYVNGVDFFDGNPIANYLVDRLNKAVRIIQEEPESDDLQITAWTDTMELNDNNVNELVISLELTPDTENYALDFIKKWLVDNLSPDEMEKYIQQNIENNIYNSCL